MTNNNQHLQNEVNNKMSQRTTQLSCELADPVPRIKGNKKLLREQPKSEETQKETQAEIHLELLNDVKIR
jgi:hypothetical protein